MFVRWKKQAPNYFVLIIECPFSFQTTGEIDITALLYYKSVFPKRHIVAAL